MFSSAVVGAAARRGGISVQSSSTHRGRRNIISASTHVVPSDIAIRAVNSVSPGSGKTPKIGGSGFAAAALVPIAFVPKCGAQPRNNKPNNKVCSVRGQPHREGVIEKQGRRLATAEQTARQ